MTTTFSLSQTFTVPVAAVLAALRDRAYIEERLALQPESRTSITRLDGNEDSWELVLTGVLPPAWMPATPLLPRGMPVGPRLTRRETWTVRRDATDEQAGAEGSMTIEILAAPVSCGAELHLQTVEGGALLGVDVRVTVPIPFMGPGIEQSIRTQITPSLRAELTLLKEQSQRG